MVDEDVVAVTEERRVLLEAVRDGLLHPSTVTLVLSESLVPAFPSCIKVMSFITTGKKGIDGE